MPTDCKPYLTTRTVVTDITQSCTVAHLYRICFQKCEQKGSDLVKQDWVLGCYLQTHTKSVMKYRTWEPAPPSYELILQKPETATIP